METLARASLINKCRVSCQVCELVSMKSLFENFTSTKLTVGVGLSVLIGGAASVLLILQSAKMLSKVSKRKISKKVSDKCVHCYVKVRVENLKDFVTCKGCEELACHNQKCSEFVYGLDVWECARCRKNRVIHQKAGEWLLKQLNQMKDLEFTSTTMTSEGKIMNKPDDEQLTPFVSRNQRERVRQMIESLLAKMLDGPLDDVPVVQLSSSEHCLPLADPIPATEKHRELKQFVQNICDEFVNLPSTFDFSGIPDRIAEPLPYFDPRQYEKLLATAVLNKMTNHFQNEKNILNDDPSAIKSHIQLDSNHNQVNSNSVIDLMASRDIDEPSTRLERLNSKAIDDETHLSDYIQSHYVPFPDLSTSHSDFSVNEDVDVQSIASSGGTDGTWEDNWLFKRRKLKTENQSIAMLVPQPSEDIKALIGDKNADETSDLSEISDNEQDDVDEVNNNNSVAESKLINLPPQAKPRFGETIPKIDINNATMIEDEPVREITTDTVFDPERISLISMDTSNPNVVTEATNNLLNFGVRNPFMGSTDRLLNELTVDVNHAITDEDFNSIISPTQVYEHRKSIDRLFEAIVTDDNNNSDEVKENVFESPPEVKQVKLVSQESSTSSTNKLDTPTRKDLSENDTDDDWELVPMSSLEDGKSLEIVVNDEGGDLRKTSVSDQQHLPSEKQVEEDTAAAVSAGVENENIPNSPKSPLKRYNSPIFENLLPEPIEPVKLSSPTLCIPADNSIDNLLETASLVSRTTKPSSGNPMHDDDEITDTTNTQIENVNDNVIEEVANNVDNDDNVDDGDENKIDNDWLSLGTLVAEKRPSMQDPELVLMQNVVPGSIAEREHIKWLKAAPIAKNPYSTEALQKRLSEHDHKNKAIDIGNTKLVSAVDEESNAAADEVSNAERDEPDTPEIDETKKADLRKYKRDYYINDEQRLSSGSASSTSMKSPTFHSAATTATMKSSSNATNNNTEHDDNDEEDDNQSDRIVPVTSASAAVALSSQKGIRACLLNPSGDIDSAGVSIASDQDNLDVRSNDDSITYSEDSDATRIYNLNTRETKIVPPNRQKQQQVRAKIAMMESPLESPVKVTQQSQFFDEEPTREESQGTNDEIPAEDNNNIVHEVVENGETPQLTNGHREMEFIEDIYEEKQVIEPDVIDRLPSVKKLAELYSSKPNDKPTEVQLHRPRRIVLRKSFLDNENEANEHRKVFKTTSENFVPRYVRDYHPAMPIASITARSIPAQIRADLKKSYSYDQDTIVRHDEREGSPEIQAGVTRNSIAFFENLKKIA